MLLRQDGSGQTHCSLIWSGRAMGFTINFQAVSATVAAQVGSGTFSS